MTNEMLEELEDTFTEGVGDNGGGMFTYRREGVDSHDSEREMPLTSESIVWGPTGDRRAVMS